MIRKLFQYKPTLLCIVFLLWTAVFALQKPVFLALYAGGVGHTLSVMAHGLTLDFSMAGYFSALTGLLLLIGCLPLSVFQSQRGQAAMVGAHKVVFAFAAICTAVSFVANLALYGYWRFPLDSSPLFFLTSSPKDALASAEWWQLLLGLGATLLVATAIYKLFAWLTGKYRDLLFRRTSLGGTIVLLLCVGLLFLPIRGGVTVSAANTGKVYFSSDVTLNHAAVNPLFSFMESVSHSENFAEQYRYMDDKTARQLTEDMLATASTAPTDSAHTSLLRLQRPDIYLVILESFSDTVMHATDAAVKGGGKQAVTPCLQSLKQEGIWFSRFYANSFRTDRGLVSILQGYPSPATVSLMKYPRKTASMPSLAAHLKQAGYDLAYYYGGDADFTNMRSFLVAQGFEKITEDVDFPISSRLSKWGVPDHLLFQRVEHDLTAQSANAITHPTLRVIQTSSSHEPFDVPYSRLQDKILNAFAYADSCVGGLVDHLKRSGRWEQSLVVLVPDHLGAWPKNADPYAPWRFHIPMIWTGGAIKEPMNLDMLGSQQDLTATLLAQLGIDYGAFTFSKDMLDASSPHYAFYMMNDGFGLIDEDNIQVFDNKQGNSIVSKGSQANRLLEKGKAYVQRIFDDIASR